MKKYYLLILTLAFSTGALFAQTYQVGDYRTKSADAAYAWDFASSWEICTVAGSPGTWTDATQVPGLDVTLDMNVYIQKNTYILLNDITIAAGGKVYIQDMGNDNTLYVGLAASGYAQYLYIYGELDLATFYTGLHVDDGSRAIIMTGGKITDNSSGSITNANSSGGIVIKSDLSNITGSLITSSGSLTGSVEQSIAKDQWHFVSSPFTNSTAADFWDTTHDAYLREYNSPGDGWGAYLNVLTTPLNVGEGYEVWQTADFEFNESGTFNVGNETLSVSQGGSSDADWNLVGNPYPCGLDWDLIDDNVNAVATTFYVLDNGSYKSYNGSTGTASHIIPPFQGFFVKSNGGGNIIVKNEDKAHPDATLYKSTKENTYSNHIRLNAELNGQVSSTFSYREEGATNGQDVDFDSPMLFSVDGSLMDVYTFAGDQKTTINIYGEYPYVMEVAFKVPAGGGDITLTPSDFRNLDANLLVYLEDKETGDYFNFLENPSYTFTAPEGDVTDRIYLIFNNNVGINDINKENIQIYSHKNAIYLNSSNDPFDGELNVFDLLGKNVFSTKISSNSYHPIYLNQPSGYYLVKLITEKESITQKVFIQQ